MIMLELSLSQAQPVQMSGIKHNFPTVLSANNLERQQTRSRPSSPWDSLVVKSSDCGPFLSLVPHFLPAKREWSHGRFKKCSQQWFRAAVGPAAPGAQEFVPYVSPTTCKDQRLQFSARNSSFSPFQSHRILCLGKLLSVTQTLLF